MDAEQLIRSGLNDSQASIYLALVKLGESTAPVIAKATAETRTNAYTVLNKLVELDLAERAKGTKKLTFRAKNPAALEKLIVNQRQEAVEREQEFHANLPAMMSSFFTSSEQPGIRYFQGKEEIRQIYEDQVAEGKETLLVRTPQDIKFFDFAYVHAIRHKSRAAGIHRRVFTPDGPEVPINHKDSDPYMLIERTWLFKDDYTAPVEWNIYGNKVAIISFGNEAIGMVIESPQIAESMRQLLKLLEISLPLRPGYDKLPMLAKYQATSHPGFKDHSKNS